MYQNSEGAWAINVRGGQPQGPPRLVRSEPFEIPAAWLPTGFYYSSSNTVSRPFRLSIDPETAQALGDPEPIPVPVEAAQWFAWAPDMERLAIAGWHDGLIHVASGQAAMSFSVGTEVLPSNVWWTPDGSEILFTTAARAQRDRSTKTVFGLDPMTGDVRELFPRLDSIHHLHVSPDGEQMVFLRRTEERLAGALVVANLGKRDGRELAPGVTADGGLSTRYGLPLFSPDGTHVLFLRNQTIGFPGDSFTSTLWVVPADGSTPPRLLVTASVITKAFWDPTGRLIAYEAAFFDEERSDISVVDLETGESHVVLDDLPQRRAHLRAWSPDGRWIGIVQTTGTSEFWVIEDLLGQRSLVH